MEKVYPVVSEVYIPQSLEPNLTSFFLPMGKHLWDKWADEHDFAKYRSR